MTAPPAARTLVIGTLFAIPPAAALAFILRYGVNVAHWDRLYDTELFRRAHDGDLSLSYLFSPHNEHRRAVHRIVVLALGSLTRWNNVAELLFGWLLVVTVAMILYRVFPRDRPRVWFVPVLLMLFTPRQHQAFLVADCLSTFLVLTFSVIALVVLSEFADWWTVPVAAAAALAATFSHAAGLILWPLGAVILFLGRRRGGYSPILWLLLGGAVIAAYLAGLENVTGAATQPGSVNPFRLLKYFIVALGGAVTNIVSAAFVAGVLLLTLSAAAFWIDRTRGARRWSPGLGLIAFGCSAVALIAVGRSQYDLAQALESRYAVFSGLTLVGIYLTAVAHEDRHARLLHAAALTLIVASVIPATVEGFAAGAAARNDRLLDAYVLYTAKYQTDETVGRIFPSVAEARARAAVLERLGLNVFAGWHPRPETLSRTEDGALFSVDIINGAPAAQGAVVRVGEHQSVIVTGWAVDRAARLGALALFGVIDGSLRIPALCGLYRPDVAAVVGRGGRRSGFLLTFSSDLLSPGGHSLALEVVAADRRRFFPTPPVAQIERR